MKMLYITPWNMKIDGFNSGSAKKSYSLVNAFTKSSINTDIYNDYIEIGLKKKDKILSRLPYFSSFNKLIYNERIINGYDVYYIRFLGPDYAFVNFLRKLRKKNHNSIILVEFPDEDYMSRYPLSFKNFHIHIKDFFFSMKLKKYVNRVILMSPKEIYKGVQSVPMMNGIDVNNVKKKESRKKENFYNIGTVASFQEAHGVDLVLKSIAKYVENGGTKIYIKLVGSGKLVDSYQKIIKEYNLQEYVSLIGPLYDEKLDVFYDSLDCGIELMAPERRKFIYSSSLKSREFLAKGIPFITASKIDVIEKHPLEYVFCVRKTDNGLFCFKDIEIFLDNIFQDDNSIRNVNNIVREYAKEYIDTIETIKPVIQYLKMKHKKS